MSKSEKTKQTLLKRILATVGNNKYLILLSLLLTVFSVALTLYIPILAGNAIDAIIGKNDVRLDVIVQNLFLIAVCAGASGMLQWLISVINNRVAYKTANDLRNRVAQHINSLPLSYIDSHPYGDIVSRVTSDTDVFTDGLLLGFSQLFNGAVTIIITLIFMLTLSPVIAIVVVALTPISLFIARFIASKTYSLFGKQSKIRGEQTALINEIVSNQKTVQAFSYEDRSAVRFDEINKELSDCSIKAIFFSSLTNPFTRFVNNLIYAAVGLSGALASLAGVLSVGGFVSFLAYANQYTKPFNEISGVITELQNAFACIQRVFELLDASPEVPDKNDALDLKNINGDIKIDGLYFSYDKSKKLLQNLNLNVSAGQKIAIVGPTGCGKTTLINLLMRFYDMDSGTISVDGIDVKNITKNSLRDHYGMVLQETWLKEGNVRENISYGNADATEEDIITAAKAAHAHSFIMRLPDGYDTVLGGKGSQLSQGEKQLLCIARAMLSAPSMLILDEATSSIDTATELKVQDAFKKLMQGKTSFVVAHRLSTVIDADVILVMKDGNIVEQGTHTELLAKNGFYTQLYNSQFAI
ncbi:MAG: ABC transporter ATP-binding protein [Clostridia bacterium]|nr:ABC transporter ATP-binding protein [Clostridia bacterium]